MKSLIILSGGVDSVTLLHDFKQHISLAVTFDYGSNHNQKEFEMAKVNTEALGIEHIRIDMVGTFKHFSSGLLSGGSAIPEGHYEDENMKKTVVPFRNGIMLSIVAGIAASRNLDTILIGNHAGDHVIYPDCREDFITAFNKALDYGLWENISVLSPYQNKTKGEIAAIGIAQLNLDYSLTYTCYKGGEKHCGKCGACVERKEALGRFDPTVYE